VETNFRILSDQCQLAAQGIAVSFQQNQVKPVFQDFAFWRPNQQDPGNLSPVHFVLDGNGIIVHF
jgi:hypothetical protein